MCEKEGSWHAAKTPSWRWTWVTVITWYTSEASMTSPRLTMNEMFVPLFPCFNSPNAILCHFGVHLRCRVFFLRVSHILSHLFSFPLPNWQQHRQAALAAHFEKSFTRPSVCWQDKTVCSLNRYLGSNAASPPIRSWNLRGEFSHRMSSPLKDTYSVWPGSYLLSAFGQICCKTWALALHEFQLGWQANGKLVSESSNIWANVFFFLITWLTDYKWKHWIVVTIKAAVGKTLSEP